MITIKPLRHKLLSIPYYLNGSKCVVLFQNFNKNLDFIKSYYSFNCKLKNFN